MNQIEFLSMNNPIRRYIQDHIEVQKLRQFSQLPRGKIILEIGCGSGNGTRLIKKYFHTREIYAIDLDSRMIALAKRHNKDTSIHFQIADAAKLAYKDNFFDAVFDFGIIHHIPNWKNCLNELKRVVKPGGELILEDLSIETFSTPFGRVMRKVLDHPYKEMYTRKEFINYLESIGFTVNQNEVYYPLHTIQYFIVIAKRTV